MIDTDPQTVYNHKVNTAKARRDSMIQAAKEAYRMDVQQAWAEMQAATAKRSLGRHA